MIGRLGKFLFAKTVFISSFVLMVGAELSSTGEKFFPVEAPSSRNDWIAATCIVGGICFICGVTAYWVGLKTYCQDIKDAQTNNNHSSQSSLSTKKSDWQPPPSPPLPTEGLKSQQPSPVLLKAELDELRRAPIQHTMTIHDSGDGFSRENIEPSIPNFYF